jgi:hypothetical protein
VTTLADRLRSARDKTIVGRVQEIARFRRLLARAGRADGCTLFVRGPAGIGKSALLRRFADLSDDARATVTILDEPEPGTRVPNDGLTVVASRYPHDPQWRVDETVELGELSPAEAAELLTARGVDPALHASILGTAGGHPLALSLAATQLPAAAAAAVLLGRVVGALPTPDQRGALELTAHVETTTAALLDEPWHYDWLRAQPYVIEVPGGIRPVTAVRHAVVADLRWRDPAGHQARRRRVRERLAAAVRDGCFASARALYHELGGEPLPGSITVSPLSSSAEVAGGSTVEHWRARQPEAFHAYHLDGVLVGFSAWLRITEPVLPADDPVVAAAWAHAQRAAPLREGEHLGVARFWPSDAGDLGQAVVLAEWLRADRLAWSYSTRPVLGPTITVDTPGGPLYAHDWRARPVPVWLALVAGATPADSAAEAVVLTRDEFDAAVRAALRAWHRPEELAANPLLRTRLLADSGNEPVTGLRRLIGDAVDELDGRLRDVVAATYRDRTATQEEAAKRLGLAYSTYRRHLSTGIDVMTTTLWSRELQAGAFR